MSWPDVKLIPHTNKTISEKNSKILFDLGKDKAKSKGKKENIAERGHYVINFRETEYRSTCAAQRVSVAGS